MAQEVLFVRQAGVSPGESVLSEEAWHFGTLQGRVCIGRGSHVQSPDGTSSCFLTAPTLSHYLHYFL